MVRLTAELINNASNYFNPLKDREIDLRGNKIGIIENLGATQDQYASIDLSDNEIQRVEGFPLLNRLRTLLLNNNVITKIAPNLHEQLPHLETLVLTNNRLNNLADIDPLSGFVSIRCLSLLDNMITKKQHYRLYVIHKLPHLRILDFRKIKQKERIASEKLFGKATKPKKQALATIIKDTTTGTAKTQQKAAAGGLSAEDQQAIRDAIKNATSMEEVASLEKSLAMGQIPASLKQNSTAMES
eukprot:TRINITY_DN1251_c0_g1_i1.p1 TRINITY_DN1251_c0_g1~~TRINITY_DN1251_c0_g1_i1.p1  ORF type:complete len:243 (+),score=61.97 TRINITY_DN1251_c0_g1_i1:184-912(+)